MEALIGIFVIIVVAALFAAIVSSIISYALNTETEKTKKPAKYRIRPKYYGGEVRLYYLQKKKWYGWVTPLDGYGYVYWKSINEQKCKEYLMNAAISLEAQKQLERDKKECFYFDVTTTEKTDEV